MAAVMRCDRRALATTTHRQQTTGPHKWGHFSLGQAVLHYGARLEQLGARDGLVMEEDISDKCQQTTIAPGAVQDWAAVKR
nr:hypothetical protein BgiMline_003270 [Biomphalaria glabrata]